jgi:hypothetical protein
MALPVGFGKSTRSSCERCAILAPGLIRSARQFRTELARLLVADRARVTAPRRQALSLVVETAQRVNAHGGEWGSTRRQSIGRQDDRRVCYRAGLRAPDTDRRSCPSVGSTAKSPREKPGAALAVELDTRQPKSVLFQEGATAPQGDPLKFVNIAVTGDGLYGLTGQGDAWKYDVSSGCGSRCP